MVNSLSASIETFNDRLSRKIKLEPVDRSQMRLETVEVDKLIELDDPARAIWDFVGRLDLGLQ